MQTKTLSQLNERIWYRLLKVVYIVIFIIVLAIGNFVIYLISQNYNPPINYNVATEKGATVKINISQFKPVFTPLTEEQYTQALNAGYSNADILRFENWRDMVANSDMLPPLTIRPPLDTFLMASFGYNNYINDLHNFETSNIYPANAFKEHKTMPTASTPNTQPKNNRGYILNLIEFFVIGNLIIIAFLEAVRRCFYYVFLGSLRPRKDARTADM